MSKAEHTHRIRPKSPNAKWEHVTDEELAQIKSQLGEQHVKANYQVEPMLKQPDKLPTTPETPPARSRRVASNDAEPPAEPKE